MINSRASAQLSGAWQRFNSHARASAVEPSLVLVALTPILLQVTESRSVQKIEHCY